MNKLYPFQEAGLQVLLTRKHNLYADEPGLGKTVGAIEMVNRLALQNVLIVCPAQIKRQWHRMLMQWLTSRRSIQIVDHKVDVIHDISQVVIVNYELLIHSYIKMQLDSRRWDLLVCDEAHRLKNMATQRTKAILSKTGLVRKTDRTLMVTGTPVLNRPIELFPILRVLAPQVIAPYSDYYKYGKRYCNGFNDGFQFNVQGASHVEELNKKLRQYYMVRRTTKQAEIELPPKRYEIIFLDPDPQVSDKVRIVCDAQRTDFKYRNTGLDGGQMATLRRTLAETKLETAKELIREYASAAGKLVIFAYHHSVLDALAGLLVDFAPVVLRGGTSQSQRNAAVTRFAQDPGCKIFIGQIQAVGEGIDGLQNSCNNVLFVEWSWSPAEIEQACKRVQRIGQAKPVLFRFLVWADTQEEHMFRVVLDKIKVIKEVLK